MVNPLLHGVFDNESVNSCGPFLAQSVDTSNSLELIGRIENGLNQQDVIGFDQIQPIGPGLQRHQQYLDIIPVLKENNVDPLVTFD